jgi:hypothetical protein
MVVVLLPLLDLLTRFSQIEEPVLVQALVTQIRTQREAANGPNRRLSFCCGVTLAKVFALLNTL